MSGQWHPDAEAIASFRAGHTGGFRGRRLAAHVAGCDRCASVGEQVAEISSILASVPAPSLPDSFERQISAALAAEAAKRAGATATAGTSAVGAGPAQLEPAGTPSPDRRKRAARSRHRQPGLRLRPAMSIVPVIICLLVGFGYLVTRGSSPTSSGSFSQAESAPSASASAAAGGAAPAAEPGAARAGAFLVTTSGFKYQAATLRTLVRNELKTQQLYGASTPVPSASASAAPKAPLSPADSVPASAHAGTNGTASSAGTAASLPRALVGCVYSLTGGAKPSLVDQAVYQGKPAYVIALPSRVWVVGLGCTASHHELITTVALSGTP